MLTTNDLRRRWREALQRARREGSQTIYLHRRPLLRLRALTPTERPPQQATVVTATVFLGQPSPFIWRAAAGERILITRWGQPIAVLEPLDAGSARANDGMEGKIE